MNLQFHFPKFKHRKFGEQGGNNQWPMPNAPCPMPHAPCPIINI
ncbi:hypothetical protein [Nostoc sp.]